MELKIHAQELTNVGDAKHAIETDADSFLNKWGKISFVNNYKC